MPPTPRPWTPAEDEIVRTLPPREAARRLGRTVPAVCTRRCKLGIAPDLRRWTPAEDALIAKMPLEQAARYLHRSPESIRQRLIKLGLLRRL